MAARHLVLFGYEVGVVYPKRSKKEDHYADLVQQCEDVGLDILNEIPPESADGRYDVIVDAIFGFSFKGEPREPFKTALRQISEAQGKGAVDSNREGTVILSVDVPSGWNVDLGDTMGTGFKPDVLISLTSPKLCSRSFEGRHFVGGRFLPPKIADKYRVKMPPYPGVSQVMEIEKVDDWQVQYAQHLAEKEAKELAVCEVGAQQQTLRTAAEAEDWASEYYKYLSEKESRQAQKEGGSEA